MAFVFKIWLPAIGLGLLVVLPSTPADGQPNPPEVQAAERTEAMPQYDPTDQYASHEIDGWRVLVNNRLVAEESLCRDTLRLLEHQLFFTRRMVPAGALDKLKDTTIWVELQDKKFPGCCYHPSEGWLKGNGYNPEKQGGVEIGNARNFLDWSRQQPHMILHELAHAYHHKVLSHGHKGIKDNYRRAVAAKNYEAVMNSRGDMVRHDALNNDQEYFAEATEAYFGRNDFYPFVRPELKHHDPTMYKLLEEIWK